MTVRLNSPGGSYFEGVAIYNTLAAYRGKVTVQVMAMAASAASIIAMAGDEIEMLAGSQMMVHRVWANISGNADDLQAMTDYLARLDTAAAEIYAARTRQPLDKIAAFMRGETYFDGAEAVKLGFATRQSGQKAEARPIIENSVIPSPPRIESSGDLAVILRNAGFAKAAASKLASGGYPALKTNPEPDNTALIAAMDALTRRIQGAR